jgi:adenylate cyclase class 2
MNNLEIEAKFWVPHLFDLRQRLIERSAVLRSPRTLERNMRFDTPDKSLTASGQVLRLRQAAVASMTFKIPGDSFEQRQELEFEVSDLERAQLLLEALGFQLIHCYEKYREIFQLGDCLVMLDEVPYGCFIEIEGPDLATIQSTCRKLDLYWDQRIQRTYLDMFMEVREQMPIKPEHATFSAFEGMVQVRADALELPRGDQPPDQENNPSWNR